MFTKPEPLQYEHCLVESVNTRVLNLDSRGIKYKTVFSASEPAGGHVPRLLYQEKERQRNHI